MKYEHLHVKSIKLTRILCVRCSFWRFLPFEACFTITVIPVKRRSQGCTLRFRPLFTTVVHDRCSKVVCVPKILLIGIFLSHTFRSKIIAPSIPKLSTHSAGNERFGSAFPSSLLSGYALNKQTGHGRGRNLGRRSIFTLAQVVRSTNVQYSSHRTETPRFDLIQDSDVKVEKS